MHYRKTRRSNPRKGYHTSRIKQAIGLGTQPSRDYGASVRIYFGLSLDELDPKGKPYIVGYEVNDDGGANSFLTKLVTAAMGDADDFEMSELLNRAISVELDIVATVRGDFARVTEVGPCPEGEGPDELADEALLYFDPEKPSDTAYKAVPTFLKKRIEASPEFIAAKAGTTSLNGKDAEAKTTTTTKSPAKSASAELDDEIPF